MAPYYGFIHKLVYLYSFGLSSVLISMHILTTCLVASAIILLKSVLHKFTKSECACDIILPQDHITGLCSQSTLYLLANSGFKPLIYAADVCNYLSTHWLLSVICSTMHITIAMHLEIILHQFV